MPRKPNVLFLMSDHATAACVSADSICRMPNLQSVAAEGVRFNRCHTTNAICSPARASLMTGTYPSTHGMWDCTHTQRREWVNVPDDMLFWSQRVAEAGYRTGYFGKWHVEQSYDLQRFGWQEAASERDASKPHHANLPRIPGSEQTVSTPGYRDFTLSAVADDSEGASHPAFDMGIDFLRRHAGDDQPFCLFISTAEPHDPYVPPKRFLDMYDPAEIPLPASLRDELAGKPEILKRLQRVFTGVGEDGWRTTIARFHATMTFIDHEIGRVVDTLKELGVYDDTIIVYTADHGDMLGAHGLATKGIGTAYEEVYRIPLVVRVPGVTGGRDENDARVSLLDVGMTLLDLLGLPELPAAQGRSFAPLLSDAGRAGEYQDAYAEFFGQRLVYTQRLVWHGPWKFVYSPGGVDELYNLDDDPHELHNMADDPAYRATVEDMCRRMWAKMREIGDDSLLNAGYATLRLAPLGPEG